MLTGHRIGGSVSIECKCNPYYTCGYCLRNAKPYFFTPLKDIPMFTTDPNKDYHIGYENGYAQFKFGFECIFACVDNPSRAIEYYLDYEGKRTDIHLDPIFPEDADYARGYMDGFERAKEDG